MNNNQDDDEAALRKQILDDFQKKNAGLLNRIKNSRYQQSKQLFEKLERSNTVDQTSPIVIADEKSSHPSQQRLDDVISQSQRSVRSRATASVRSKPGSNYSKLSQAGNRIMENASSYRSFNENNSIRTTTTTRERLAEIENQLAEEIQKRKSAESKIRTLKNRTGI